MHSLFSCAGKFLSQRQPAPAHEALRHEYVCNHVLAALLKVSNSEEMRLYSTSSGCSSTYTYVH